MPYTVFRACLAVLPAYAGMILHARAGHRLISCAPRVCGDDPRALRIANQIGGVLPAYAGMILSGMCA